MKTFLKRLKYYGLGFGIGTVFLFFFFENRGCSWMPSNRVKSNVTERLLVASKSDKQILKLFTSKNSFNRFIENAKVDFNKSKTRQNPKVYCLRYENKEIYVLLPKESFVGELKSKKNGFKLSRKEEGVFIHLPKKTDFLYIDKNVNKKCLFFNFGVNDEQGLYTKLINKGYFLFNESTLLNNSSQYHCFRMYLKDSIRVDFKSIFYKEKIDIVKVDYEEGIACEE